MDFREKLEIGQEVIAGKKDNLYACIKCKSKNTECKGVKFTDKDKITYNLKCKKCKAEWRYMEKKTIKIMIGLRMNQSSQRFLYTGSGFDLRAELAYSFETEEKAIETMIKINRTLIDWGFSSHTLEVITA